MAAGMLRDAGMLQGGMCSKGETEGQRGADLPLQLEKEEKADPEGEGSLGAV